MGLFSKKKNDGEDNIWTRNAEAHHNLGHGVVEHLTNQPSVFNGRCSYPGCNKRLIGSYGFDNNGNPVCLKHVR